MPKRLGSYLSPGLLCEWTLTYILLLLEITLYRPHLFFAEASEARLLKNVRGLLWKQIDGSSNICSYPLVRLLKPVRLSAGCVYTRVPGAVEPEGIGTCQVSTGDQPCIL